MKPSNSSNQGTEDSAGGPDGIQGYNSDVLPTYEDSLNHNDITDKDKKSVDTIETLDIDEKEKKKEEKNSDILDRITCYITGLNFDPRESTMWKEVDGDKLHICVLFFLYILQGIPLGLRSSIPLVLQERGISYTDQSKFSFASYPFSMKILWAPIVDSIFIKKFGRRKTWLIPTQMLIGENKVKIVYVKFFGDHGKKFSHIENHVINFA